ncbi:MAG: MerR family transcriptional regulator [Kineosporiaceae bacterium]
MLTIGDFATFAGVSVRALRFWDREGVLHPADVDPRTGYRRYAAAQLVVAHRVRSFQALGFTLDQIRGLLGEPPGSDRMAAMLHALQAEAERARDAADARIARIGASLRLMEEMTMTDTTSTTTGTAYDVVRKTSPTVRLAMIGESLGPCDPSTADYGAVFGRLFGELMGRLGAAGVRPVGPAWSLYDTSTEDGLVVHAGLPIAPGWDGDERVRVVDRPSAEVASTIHTGSMTGMPAAYAAITAWIEANGLGVTGGAAEISLEWDDVASAANVTEVMIPVAPRT